MLIDENAFGLLVSFFDVEDEEYGLERDPFVARFEGFRRIVRSSLGDSPLGSNVRALDLGHAWYFEVAAGEHTESPLGWLRRLRGRLGEEGFATFGVVTYGGRWVSEETSSFLSTEHIGEVSVVSLSNPSEPLRRALYADGASRPAESDDEDDDSVEGWGPGLYLDTEAAAPLAIKPKNAPTILRVAGAEFFRVGA